ncbi:MAG: isocitrate lyase/PEP mutase family protein [Vulcanimicrobiaceae bacterium]
MSEQNHIESLRRILAERRGVLVAGAPNALTARIIADVGFEVVYLTGAGLTNMYLGMPDLGFMDLTQLVQHTMAIRNVVNRPLVVDADTGFGNPLNVAHTVRLLERAGASAIQIEDQVAPKRCGHFEGKAVISSVEMVNKIKAAVDARREDVVIIARTDARAVEGFNSAVERAALYAEAGADVTFVEAPHTVEELRQIPKLLPLPQLLNLVIGGKTPILDRTEAESMGYAMILYANTALQGAIRGMQTALKALHQTGSLSATSDLVVSFEERQRLVDKARFDEMGSRYE